MKVIFKKVVILLPALLAAVCAGPARAAIWGRGKVPAPWSNAAIAVDGKISDWPPGETYDASGLRFRALNDGESLYITVSAHEAGARSVLTGEIRQDVTLWFLDGKTRALGLRLPFGNLGLPWENGPSAGSIEPELLTTEGTAVSTAPLPGNIEFGGEIPGRVPIYELKIPLALLKTVGGKIALDFTTAYASPELERQMKERFQKAAERRSGAQSGPSAGMKPQSGMSGRGGGKMGGGMRGGGKGGGGGRGGSGAQPEFPSPMEIQLSVLPGAGSGPRAQVQSAAWKSPE
ncbi:MAG: hypothetical protein A2X28_03615 [Elusimicrobia bacterium GWA2_56_46]|nr:MAG: hypothetical protein A2X28_03615 [Elusimicrobia bacterium GWA2_56_46]OGR54965.1 MAG: hypothetical protein A2X39_02550 [Elusimicrobia bacterium GWC2_56_31]HBW24027.1 hypothetical protein [Elusimicrobiota bacterium]